MNRDEQVSRNFFDALCKDFRTALEGSRGTIAPGDGYASAMIELLSISCGNVLMERYHSQTPDYTIPTADRQRLWPGEPVTAGPEILAYSPIFVEPIELGDDESVASYYEKHGIDPMEPRYMPDPAFEIEDARRSHDKWTLNQQSIRDASDQDFDR